AAVRAALAAVLGTVIAPVPAPTTPVGRTLTAVLALRPALTTLVPPLTCPVLAGLVALLGPVVTIGMRALLGTVARRLVPGLPLGTGGATRRATRRGRPLIGLARAGLP
ncbi:hypothetical protein, partial [Intrasporangium chromatireducens]|uniref:hypothetical protein n=1 Tax=Intrasporangium chromatireducens TaxID=1386088 RepID=UPI00054F4FC8